MRNAFARSLEKILIQNPKVILLSGDIGNRLFDKIKLNYPNNFYNCGVAEGNMTGVASGLASSGFIPITYTITPFNTLRCLEQIRNDICYPKLPTIIVGTGSGLSYSRLGPTHHSNEDIAILRSFPNLTIFCPGDPLEVEVGLKEVIQLGSPVYFRLGKKGEPIINKKNLKIKIGKANIIKKGKDISIICVGNTLGIGDEVSDILRKKNLFSDLVSLHTIKPLDNNFLKNTFKSNKKIFLIEEHYKIGGACTAILEWAHNNKINTENFFSFSLKDEFYNGLGEQSEARNFLGLNSKTITRKILKII